MHAANGQEALRLTCWGLSRGKEPGARPPRGPRISFVSPARLRAWLGVQGACSPLCRRVPRRHSPPLGYLDQDEGASEGKGKLLVRHGSCLCPFILAKIPILRRYSPAMAFENCVFEGRLPSPEQSGDQSCKRPMRPPRRLARRGARVGRSAMIALRASCVRRDQEEISSIVRKQPTQIRSAGWIVQSLTQGDCTSSRCQTSSFTSAPRFPYGPSCRGHPARYSPPPRHRSPLSDAFATYPPRAVPFLPQRWRGVHPRR